MNRGTAAALLNTIQSQIAANDIVVDATIANTARRGQHDIAVAARDLALAATIDDVWSEMTANDQSIAAGYATDYDDRTERICRALADAVVTASCEDESGQYPELETVTLVRPS